MKMQKTKFPSYFMLEKSTGAFDGYYSDKKSAQGVADLLSDEWEGSLWLVCKIEGQCGDKQNFKSIFWHRDERMIKTLTHFYGEKKLVD